jgi:NAD(P)H-dependent FMN reductase
MNKINVAIISGSNRMGAKSREVAIWLQNFLADHEEINNCALLDISSYNFPVMDERFGHLETPHDGLEEFSNALHAADALMIVTPEYNGGMAGSLKNTIDYYRKEFDKKAVGAITVSSGDFAGVNALHQLWYVMLHCGAIVSPSKLLIGNVNSLLNEKGEIHDEKFMKRASIFTSNVLWLAKKLKSTES